MILKEGIRYNDPVLKLFKNNKNITVKEINDEQEDFRFWAGMMKKFRMTDEQIDAIFASALSADDVAEKVYNAVGDSEEYKLAFAESISEPIVLSENEEDGEVDDIIVVVYKDGTYDVEECYNDHEASARFEELVQMNVSELDDKEIAGAAHIWRNDEGYFEQVDTTFNAGDGDMNTTELATDKYLAIINGEDPESVESVVEGKFKHFTIEVNGELLEDEFGNTLRFDTAAEAEEYIEEHELEGAEVLGQLGFAEAVESKYKWFVYLHSPAGTELIGSAETKEKADEIAAKKDAQWQPGYMWYVEVTDKEQKETNYWD